MSERADDREQVEPIRRPRPRYDKAVTAENKRRIRGRKRRRKRKPIYQ